MNFLQKMINAKICCIQSIEEAKIAINGGAYAIGLVSKMPSGPGVITEYKIKEIADWAKGKTKTVLLTALQNADGLIEQNKYCQSDVIQLVDSQDIYTYKKLKRELPKVELMQVIHVIDEYSVQESIEISNYVDFILLDSGNPNLKTKELGGTGRTHNWEISKQIVNEIEIPVFLAGGLNPKNVCEAIKTVKPFGVDLCSGLRIDSKLIEARVKSFMNNIN